jgi:hypothetical protein
LNKFVTIIGDDSTRGFRVDHPLGPDVLVQIWTTAMPAHPVVPDRIWINDDCIMLNFENPPALHGLRIVIIG